METLLIVNSGDRLRVILVFLQMTSASSLGLK